MSGEKPMKARDIAMAARSLGAQVQRRHDKAFRVGRLNAQDELARVLQLLRSVLPKQLTPRV